MFNNRVIPLYICGDSAYPNLRKMVTPFKKVPGLSAGERRRRKKYNRKLSRGRIVVEQAIGQLKMRFPILKNKMRVRRKNVPAIVHCLAILHNVCIAMGMDIEDEVNEDDNSDDDDTVVELDVDGEENTDLCDMLCELAQTLV